ncbi:MAG TPA: DUF362 domain-containing protein [Candidatus Aminicenantes bacterium]|nr:DUF362 domain-containing protein [Candidatus Aminicenantes bacterium]
MNAKENRLAKVWLLGCLGVVLLLPLLVQGATGSRVVVARSPRVVDERNVADAAETTRLFDRSLLALTGQKTAAEAWAVLNLGPGDTVAIKINCNDWTVALHPHTELLEALCASLQKVVPAGRIVIYEGSGKDLRSSGYRAQGALAGVRFLAGDDAGIGYDETEKLTRIVTGTATKLINLASLKCVDGDLGVSLFLKNHVGSLLPVDMPKCHDDPDFLAAISARPSIRRKTILNLLDGLRGTYRRGVPWYWGGLILSADPLAGEAVALDVINERRAQDKVPPLPQSEALRLADSKYHLGTCQQAGIEKIVIDL